MRIAFANAYYRPGNPNGGHAHMAQFINNAVAAGHEIFTWSSTHHPLGKPIPNKRIPQLKLLRTMDAIYTRLEWNVPRACTWATGPMRRILRRPLMVWEFNVVPEYGELHDIPRAQIDEAIASFRRHAPGCDLAVCVSQAIADYCRERLGIGRTLVVPNGSDPELFRPDAEPVARITRAPGRINVLWLGSAGIKWTSFDLLRDAAMKLWREGAGEAVTFHVIGSGMNCMREMPPNVHYQGWEQYDRLPGWLAAMDVGLVLYGPGLGQYSSPLKLFDYLASGLAIVATEQPQVRQILTETGQADAIIPYDDATALADVLLKLARDPEELARRKAASRQAAVERYSWRRAVDDTIREMEQVAAGRQH